LLKTNKKRLVEFLLQCQPGPPRTRGSWGINHQGKPFILPSIGGITLKILVGDSAFGWAGLGPGVTTLMTCEKSLIKPVIDPRANIADLYGIGTSLPEK